MLMLRFMLKTFWASPPGHFFSKPQVVPHFPQGYKASERHERVKTATRVTFLESGDFHAR